jgi:DNA-binding response OmpR family regulator
VCSVAGEKTQILSGGFLASGNPAVLLVVGKERRDDLLVDGLTLDGYQVSRASDPAALRALRTAAPVDLLLLGGAPDQRASFDVLRALRAGELAPAVPRGVRVLWVTKSKEVSEVLRAFEVGADDVIRTPFLYAELLARVRARLRREHADTPSVIECGALRIDTPAHEAAFRGTPIGLCRQEYALLVHLARNPNRVYTKAELQRDVWGFRAYSSTRTVDSHACRLRRKLMQAGAEGFMTAIWGVGYRLAPSLVQNIAA